MSYQNITGLWRSQRGTLSFKMTDEIKQKVNAVPNGTFVNLFLNEEKRSEKAPDANLSYKAEQQASYQGSRNTLGPDVNSRAAVNYYANEDIPF